MHLHAFYILKSVLKFTFVFTLILVFDMALFSQCYIYYLLYYKYFKKGLYFQRILFALCWMILKTFF